MLSLKREEKVRAKQGVNLSLSFHYIFINKSSWRTREAPWRGSHQCPNKLALTDRVLVGNNRLLRSVEPQVANPGINLSDIRGAPLMEITVNSLHRRLHH